MTEIPNQTSPTENAQMEVAVHQINKALEAYSNKDWNYSRIHLVIRPLQDFDSPYALTIESLDLNTTVGQNDLKALVEELKWGERHSSELGVLEVVSLRVNKALLEITSDQYWDHMLRPVVRIAKKDVLAGKKFTNAIWYQVTEVAGEDFDNR
jgi:hypothetical protein